MCDLVRAQTCLEKELAGGRGGYRFIPITQDLLGTFHLLLTSLGFGLQNDCGLADRTLLHDPCMEGRSSRLSVTYFCRFFADERWLSGTNRMGCKALSGQLSLEK